MQERRMHMVSYKKFAKRLSKEFIVVPKKTGQEGVDKLYKYILLNNYVQTRFNLVERDTDFFGEFPWIPKDIEAFYAIKMGIDYADYPNKLAYILRSLKDYPTGAPNSMLQAAQSYITDFLREEDSGIPAKECIENILNTDISLLTDNKFHGSEILVDDDTILVVDDNMKAEIKSKLAEGYKLTQDEDKEVYLENDSTKLLVRTLCGRVGITKYLYDFRGSY